MIACGCDSKAGQQDHCIPASLAGWNAPCSPRQEKKITSFQPAWLIRCSHHLYDAQKILMPPFIMFAPNVVPELTHNLNCLKFGAPRASEPAIFAGPYHGRDRHTERGGMFLLQSSNMLAAEVRLQEQSRSHVHIPRTYHDLFCVCRRFNLAPCVQPTGTLSTAAAAEPASAVLSGGRRPPFFWLSWKVALQAQQAC